MKRQCLIIFSLALLIRLGFAIPAFIHPERGFGFGADSYQYNELAKNMIEYHRFSVYPESAYIPEPARTPGYPFLIGIVYSIFGPKPQIIIFLQTLIDAITAVLIYIIVAFSFTRLAGFISGIIYAVNLHQALYTTQILTETSFTFFLFLSLFFLLRFIKIRNYYYLIISSILIGVATFIKPIAIYFPIFICIWLLISFKDRLKIALKSSAIVLLVFIAVITPWGLRNYLCFGKFFISIMDDINLAQFNAASVLARKEKITEDEARKRIFELLKEKYKLSAEEIALFGDSPKVSGLMRNIGLEIIRKNPGIYAIEHGLGFLKVFVHSELAYWSRLFYGYEREKLKAIRPISKEVLRLIFKGKIKMAINLFNKERLQIFPLHLISLWGFISVFELLVYVISFFGVVSLSKNSSARLRALPILFILTIFYFAFLPGPVGDARFRVPIEPYISILAGCGLINFIKRRT
ncbi:glycosyltransferase family 39 protein [candidate division WOR-3 bacterium]|nr:glycosyltransferase family 39 protein [candidate division WOR-3 bacterium]